MGKKKERKKEITYRKMVVILFHLSSQVKGRFGWERSLEWLLRRLMAYTTLEMLPRGSAAW